LNYGADFGTMFHDISVDFVIFYECESISVRQGAAAYRFVLPSGLTVINICKF